MAEVNLPEGWALATIGLVARVASGVGFPMKYQGQAEGLYPVYKVGDVSKAVTSKNGNLAVAGHYVNEIEAAELKGEIFPVGATLFAKIGEAVKLNRRAFVKKPGLADNNVMAVVPDKADSDRFLYQFLRVIDLAEVSRSTTVPSIRKGDIEEIELLLPPLTEQKVIAEKLDSLLAQVDCIKARLERVFEVLKSFRQSVLSAAVSGKLTEAWRETHDCVPVVEFLKAIERERLKLINSKKLKKSTLPRTAIEQFESELPHSWLRVNFEHIAAYDSNALKAGPFGSALKKSDCTSSGYRVYGQEQVIAGDENLITYYINEKKFNDLSSCSVESGDILVSLVGTIGKVLILSDNAEKGIINPRLVKLSLQPEINRKYIQFYLQSIAALDYFKGFSHGGTMDILNLGILKDLPINLPPCEEQTEIVRWVEEIFAFSDHIEQAAQAALSRVNNLTQSILAKAFRGELTADWRAANSALISGENSAKTLLTSIKASRNSTPKNKNKGIPKTNRPKTANLTDKIERKSVLGVIAYHEKVLPQQIFDELKEVLTLQEVLAELSELIKSKKIEEFVSEKNKYWMLKQ